MVIISCFVATVCNDLMIIEIVLSPACPFLCLKRYQCEVSFPWRRCKLWLSYKVHQRKQHYFLIVGIVLVLLPTLTDKERYEGIRYDHQGYMIRFNNETYHLSHSKTNRRLFDFLSYVWNCVVYSNIILCVQEATLLSPVPNNSYQVTNTNTPNSPSRRLQYCEYTICFYYPIVCQLYIKSYRILSKSNQYRVLIPSHSPI